MKLVETLPLGDFVKRYDSAKYQIRLLALEQAIPLNHFRWLLQIIRAGSMIVEVYDTDKGLQLFDPGRNMHIAWITPNPLQKTTAEEVIE